MRPGRILSTAGTIAAALFLHAQGQDTEPGAAKILGKMDTVLYSARDKKMTMTFMLLDKSGSEKIRTLEALEKGNDHRMMRFIAPADQKGIAFLSLPGSMMYLYLPAFGKVRRIASHVKNRDFAGTDLSYEDLEAKAYGPRWNAAILETTAETYRLELTPKKDVDTDYSRLIVEVRKDSYYPVKVDYFDKAGTRCKVMERKKIEKIGGYWEARETVVRNLVNGHQTTLKLDKVEYDSNIDDECFSQRYLSR